MTIQHGIRVNFNQFAHQLFQVLLVGMTIGMMRTVIPALAETEFGVPEHCLYFSAEEPPLREPLLVVNAEGRGPINNLCVPSLVASTYAPAGCSLISVTVIGEHLVSKSNLEEAVRDQLSEWYGKAANRWELLRVYSIRHALPDQPAPAPTPTVAVGELRPGIFVCGEYGSLPSIQWALMSGRLAAEAVLAAAAQRRNL